MFAGDGSNVWEMVVMAVTTLPLRWKAEEGGVASEFSSSSSSLADPSTERQGVPVVISVQTDWLSESKAAVAAEWRAEMMLGPGSR